MYDTVTTSHPRTTNDDRSTVTGHRRADNAIPAHREKYSHAMGPGSQTYEG